MISVDEAGQLLGISRGLAYTLVNRGDIPSIRLGRRIVPAKRSTSYSTFQTTRRRPGSLVGRHSLIRPRCSVKPRRQLLAVGRARLRCTAPWAYILATDAAEPGDPERTRQTGSLGHSRSEARPRQMRR